MSSVSHFDSARDSRGHLMHELRRQLDRWEVAAQAEGAAMFSSGAPAIDRLLPAGGLRHGMLIEWISEAVGAGGSPASRRTGGPPVATFDSGGPPVATFDSGGPPVATFNCGGAATLSLLAAREACREGGTLVVLDRQQTFYPPAAAAWGIDLDRLIVVRPRNARDELWAAVQSLRSAAVAAVWGMIDRLDSRAFRRLQLAAQAGRTLGLLLRPPSARGQPSWADVRLAVSPSSVVRGPLHSYHGQRTTDNGRYLHVRMLRCHGGRPGSTATLEIDDATYRVREIASHHAAHPLPVVTQLADSADRSRPARA